MIPFLLAFLLCYGGLHLWVLSRLAVLFKPHGLLLIPVLFLYLGPVLTYWVLRWGQEALGRAMYLLSFSWMAFLFLCGAFLLLAEGGRLLGILSAKRGAVGSVILSWGILLYGYGEALRPRVKVIELATPKVSRPYTVAVIADLHAGPVVRGGRLERLLEPLRGNPPDMLLSAGDLLDSEVLDDLRPLVDLRPPWGKYAVLGNHEAYLGPARAQGILEALGFRVLRNEALRVGELVLVGVDDPHVPGPRNREEMALSGLDRKSYKILLKHRPEVSPRSAGLFDLQLSGHTHGGQIFPFNLLVRLFYPKGSGLIPVGEGYLYASNGLGTWGPPMRFLSPPEMALVKLVPSP